MQYIVFPDSRTTIGNSAFNGCSSLVKIKLPNNITEIWWYAFSCCTSLKSIIIPKTITKIYDYAFNNCTTLSDVYYNGTQTEWNNIDIGTSNSYFTNANIHFIYTETETEDNKFVVTPTGVPENSSIIFVCYENDRMSYVKVHTYTGEGTIPFSPDKKYDEVKIFV